jgi:bacterioferritin
MFKNWGLEKLAAHEHKESIDEMKHADKLMERILFLEGRPAVQLKKLLVGESTKEVLSCDLKLELAGHPDLKEAIVYCEKIGDFVSRDLFQSIIESEEVSPGGVLDYNAQNEVVGVEILHLSRRAPGLNPRELQFQTA